MELDVSLVEVEVSFEVEVSLVELEVSLTTC